MRVSLERARFLALQFAPAAGVRPAEKKSTSSNVCVVILSFFGAYLCD